MGLRALPEHYGATRTELQRIATHVLARRRMDLCAKFGLRATPGGIGTPASGGEHEVVRIAGTTLVREVTGVESRTLGGFQPCPVTVIPPFVNSPSN